MKAGLIGLGAIGAMHFKNISEGKIDGLELAGVFDERPPAPEKFPGAKIYKSLCEMFSDPDVDAVIIATPSFSHFELAKAALEAGKHALVEKPIALASADARELVKIAKDCGKICAVMLNQRTTPIYARIRELVASGELGRVNPSAQAVPVCPCACRQNPASPVSSLQSADGKIDCTLCAPAPRSLALTPKPFRRRYLPSPL